MHEHFSLRYRRMLRRKRNSSKFQYLILLTRIRFVLQLFQAFLAFSIPPYYRQVEVSVHFAEDSESLTVAKKIDSYHLFEFN